MDELGIDLAKEFPKPLTTDAVRAADVVITMGCGDACPVLPGKRYLDWELEDPAGKTVDEAGQSRSRPTSRRWPRSGSCSPTSMAPRRSTGSTRTA